MNTSTQRVLLTGALGMVGSQLVPALREAYDLRMVDVKDTDRQGQRLEGVELFDLVESSDAEVTELFSAFDAIVHCGSLQPIGEPSYASERRNVDLMERIYRLALAAGVKRIVAASTNQASKWYEQPWFEGRIDRVAPDDYPRPDTFYGWAKVAYESLGFLYACGSLGRRLEVVQIRIVAPREIDATAFEDRPLWRLPTRHHWLHQSARPAAVVRTVPGRRVDRRPLRRALSDLLRRLEQRSHVLEHHQRPRGGRLRTPGRLGDRFCRRHRPDDRPRLRHPIARDDATVDEGAGGVSKCLFQMRSSSGSRAALRVRSRAARR